MYICIQTIMRWAMISFWGGLFYFLFYLVLIFWVRKEETKIKPYISMVLWERTGKVTVSPLPAVLLLYVRDGFLQLCHRDGEVATPHCPPMWSDTSQSQDLASPRPHGKQRTKWGAVVLPEPLPWLASPVQQSGLSQQLVGNATSQSRSQSLSQHPS